MTHNAPARPLRRRMAHRTLIAVALAAVLAVPMTSGQGVARQDAAASGFAAASRTHTQVVPVLQLEPLALKKYARGAVITTAALRLRHKPTTASKTLVTIPKGKHVKISARKGVWGKTAYRGKTGWVHTGYVKAAPKVVKAPKAAAKSTIKRASSGINTSQRASVAAAYKKLVAAERITPRWSGSTSTCRPGSESAASKSATLKAINFFRGMVQLSPVSLAEKWNAQALRSSLLMSARGQITHTPSKSGRCWSSAARTAAGTSNLYLGVTGARAIRGYMTDPGSGNTAAGHRRWILQPSTAVMGTGSTSNANTLKVIGTKTASRYSSPAWMEWPSAGYFPAPLEPAGRWSLSSSTADFRSAKVAVKNSAGKKLKVHPYKVANGYGPNTLVFKVAGVKKPARGKVAVYTVTVSHIKHAASSSYTYKVRMFAP